MGVVGVDGRVIAVRVRGGGGSDASSCAGTIESGASDPAEPPDSVIGLGAGWCVFAGRAAGAGAAAAASAPPS